jgi:glycopeptide antibiotics resistance protein
MGMTVMENRNVGFILLGVMVLVFKSHYSGPVEELVHSYAGNISVSCAVYFLALHVPIKSKHKKLLAAGFALAAVQLFEILNGFGLMSNVYDSMDLIANFAGVALGFVIDTALTFRQWGARNT